MDWTVEDSEESRPLQPDRRDGLVFLADPGTGQIRYTMKSDGRGDAPRPGDHVCEVLCGEPMALRDCPFQQALKTDQPMRGLVRSGTGGHLSEMEVTPLYGPEGERLLQVRLRPVEQDREGVSGAINLTSLEGLLAHRGEALFTQGPDHRYRMIAGDYRAILGLTPDTPVIGAGDRDLFPSDLAEFLQTEVARRLAHGDVATREFHPTEGGLPLGLTTAAIRHEVTGEVEEVVGVLQNIQDRVAARAYQRQLEAYKGIFDELPVGVCRNHPGADGSFAEANRAMARLFEADSPEHLMQYNAMDLHRNREDRQGIVSELMEVGEIHRHPVALQTIHGRPIWTAITARVRHDEAGNPVFDGILEDITAEKEAEQARERLRMRESFIQSFIAGMPDMIFHKTPDGVYIECNEEFGRFTGIAPLQIPGQTDHDLFDPTTADFFRYHDRKMLETGEPRHNEEWIQYPDGEWALLDMVKTPYRGEDGVIHGIIGVGRDITRRHHIEAQLRTSQQEVEWARRRAQVDADKWAAIMDQAPVGFWIGYPGGKTRWVNAFFRDLIGNRLENGQGVTDSPLTDFLAPASRDHLNAMWDDPEEAQRGRRVDLLDHNGDPIPAHMRMVSFRERTGGHPFYVAYFFPLHEIISREEQERRFLDILHASPEMVLICDESEGERPSFANRAARSFFGENPDCQGARLNEAERHAVAEHHSHITETQVRGQEGQSLRVQKIVVPFRNHYTGQIGYSIIFQNVEAIHQAEQDNRILSERLDQTRRVAQMGQIGSMIGHELKQPLMEVQFDTENLARKLENEPNLQAGDALRRKVTAINTSQSRAMAIVDRVRHFLRQGAPNREPHRLLDLIREVEPLLPAVDGVAMEVDGPDLDPIPVDKVQMQVVVSNLMRNAIEALRDHGTSDGHPPMVRVALTEKGHEQVMEVTDNGPGMSTYKKAFPTMPSEEDPQNLGLGQQICWTLVEQHEGQMTVTERKGGGMRVVIGLPTRAED